MTSFEAGQWLAMKGRGLVQIQALDCDAIVVREAELPAGDDSTLVVPRASADEVLRPLADSATASHLLAELSAAGGVDRALARETPGRRMIAYRGAIKGGDLAEQVAALRSIYRHPDPDHPERQYEGPLEKLVFGELAHALGEARKALRARARAEVFGEALPAHLALPDRSAELARELPPVEGHEVVGAFAIDTRLAIGEGRPELVLAARPGVWQAYLRNETDDGPAALVAIHASVAEDLAALRAEASRAGEVTQEGGTLVLFDAAMVDDPEFFDDAMIAHGPVGQRAVVVSTGGDGVSPVHVALRDGAAVWVCVRFD
jgi:hypothetical protein